HELVDVLVGLRPEERVAPHPAEGGGHAALGGGRDHHDEDEKDADDEEDRRQRVIAEARAGQEERDHDLYLTIFANESALRLAPPTRAPSTSSSAMSSLTFSGVTLPP